MGALLSCLKDRTSDENEGLLANQQNGYGADTGEDVSALQRQMKEHEEQMFAREQLLKEIVANTNDKLIDISMISNSGIVVQGSDLKPVSQEIEHEREHPLTAESENNDSGAKNTLEDNLGDQFVVLDTDTALSEETKKQLKSLHKRIFDNLENQLHVEAPGKLTVTL